MKKLFVDFDGTLVDISERFFKVHADLVGRLGGVALDRQTYWEGKRAGVPERILVAECWESGGMIGAYLAERRQLLEHPRYLGFDRLAAPVGRTLERLAASFQLHLVSFRRDGYLLMDELERFNLACYFGRVVVAGEGNWRDGAEFKEAVLLGFEARSDDVVVGDAEDDGVAAGILGVYSVGVLSGIRGREQLGLSGFDCVIPDITHIFSVI